MYQRQGVAQQHEARRVVGQVLGDLVEALVHCPVLVLLDLLGLLVDQVCGRESARAVGRDRAPARETHVQMTAWGSEARDVPRRNLRSAALVSCEKTYSLASELCGADRPSASAQRGKEGYTVTHHLVLLAGRQSSALGYKGQRS